MKRTITVVFVCIFFSCSKPVENDNTNDLDRKYTLVYGDILLDNENPDQNIRQKGFRELNSTLWPDGRVPYHFNSNLTSMQRRLVRWYFDEIEDIVNVTFIERSNGSRFIYEINTTDDEDIGGRSTLGYTSYPYMELKQFGRRTIIHETLHGLGISHEHQRYDRDNYIKVNWSAISDDFKSQYEKVPHYINLLSFRYEISKAYGTYDYASIMHYHQYSGPNKNFTIKTNYTGDIGGIELSNSDINTLRGLYGKPLLKVFIGAKYDRIKFGQNQVMSAGSSRNFGKVTYKWYVQKTTPFDLIGHHKSVAMKKKMIADPDFKPKPYVYIGTGHSKTISVKESEFNFPSYVAESARIGIINVRCVVNDSRSRKVTKHFSFQATK